MSDTVKIVIEINSRIIYAIQNNKGVTLGNQIDICNAIKNGKPLSENKGEWINAKVGKLFPSNDYKCSICGNILDFEGVNCGRGDANFCPNCGADMRGE